MKPLKVFLGLSLILSFTATARAQKLPKLAEMPTPQFQSHSFCPKQGLIDSNLDDPELNEAKNRIDDNPTYFPVAFDEILKLDFPETAGRKKRSSWKVDERKAIKKFEGMPIRLEGFLAVVNNGSKKKPRFGGARSEGEESCNCNSTLPDQIDYHIWLLNSPGDSLADSVVIEMTPRVRKKHPRWTVKDLTYIAAKKFPVRVSGWLMFDGQHPDEIGSTRGTIWEIHPIMKLEFKQGNTWKPL